jgi:hypothetical protein
MRRARPPRAGATRVRLAVGIDGAAVSGPDACAGAHRHLLSSRRIISRWDRRRRCIPRGFGWWCSSSAPFVEVCRQPLGSMQAVYPARTLVVVLIGAPSSVGVHAVALAGGDNGLCAHGGLHPLGSMKEPAAARTRVLVFIRVSWLVDQPLGSMQPPPAAWTLVMVFMRSPSQPSGSRAGPSPARTLVVVLISISFSRWGPAPCPCRHGGASWCSSPSPSPVGVRAGSLAGAEVRGGAHVSLLHPFGSAPYPLPARTCVMVLISASFTRWDPRRRPGRRGGS